MKETVPYNPTVDFFTNINDAKKLFDKEDQQLVKTVIMKYYPEIWTDDEEDEEISDSEIANAENNSTGN